MRPQPPNKAVIITAKPVYVALLQHFQSHWHALLDFEVYSRYSSFTEKPLLQLVSTIVEILHVGTTASEPSLNQKYGMVGRTCQHYTTSTGGII